MKLILLLYAIASMFQAAVNPLDQGDLKSYLLENKAPFDFILIDVRAADEISAAIGNDYCKPYNLAWPEQFKDLALKIEKDQPVVVYCRSGVRAGKAADFLRSSGYTRVYNAGGILTWTGPTVPHSDIKSASLLPEPSMRIKQDSKFQVPDSR